MNVENLIKLDDDERITKIDDIFDHVSTAKEYKALFEDGTVDWVTIVVDQNQHVKTYFEQQGVNIEVFDAAKAGWMNPQWVEHVSD